MRRGAEEPGDGQHRTVLAEERETYSGSGGAEGGSEEGLHCLSKSHSFVEKRNGLGVTDVTIRGARVKN